MLRSLVLTAAALVASLPGDFSAAAGEASKAGAPRSGVVVEYRGTDGLFRVPARLGNSELRLVIDTGASTLVVSERDATAAGLSSGGAIGILHAAGGPIRVRWTRAARLAIAETILQDIDVAVVEGPLSAPLAGQDVLARLGTVTFAGDRLVISPPHLREAAASGVGDAGQLPPTPHR